MTIQILRRACLTTELHIQRRLELRVVPDLREQQRGGQRRRRGGCARAACAACATRAAKAGGGNEPKLLDKVQVHIAGDRRALGGLTDELAEGCGLRERRATRAGLDDRADPVLCAGDDRRAVDDGGVAKRLRLLLEGRWRSSRIADVRRPIRVRE